MLDIFDLYLAAYMLVAGCKLVKAIDRNGITTFSFADTDGLASRCLGEWRQHLVCANIREYVKALAAIRRVITVSRQSTQIMEKTNDSSSILNA